MRIVLLGPPGSGKAELSRQISKHYGIPVITVDSVMQRAAAEQSELGRLAKEAMDMSRVSDELLLALLRIQMPQMDLSKGFVLVDLPKNAGQADVLDSVLSDLAADVELVFNLEVDRDELMERLVGRIACDNCGAQYNMYVNPPMVEGVCDECGARVVRRPDDYEETISNRLRVYEGQMAPLLQYYQLNHKLHRIQADEGPAKVWKAVRTRIDAMPLSTAPAGAGAKPAAKKATAKKATAKAAPAKKAAATKPVAAKKTTVGKAAAKETAGKKAPTAGKAATKKPNAKKSAAKKPTAKKAVVKKAVAKKTTKKVVAKPSTTRKPAAKRTAAKKAVSKKAVAKKAAVKKAAVKKAASRSAAATKSAAAFKASAKKAAAKKSASKKAVARQAAKTRSKTAPARNAATKKAAARKTAAKKAKKKPVRR